MDDQNVPDVRLPSVDASQAMSSAVPQPVPAQIPASPQGQSMQQAIAASLPYDAKDLDLIEKAWVEKAKQIVARTHGDPHLQNKALSQVKADYIRKRYGKDIKVIE